MKLIHFKNVSITLPIKGNVDVEQIEDKFIDAVDSIGDGVVMCYKVEVEEDGDGDAEN